MKKMILEAVEVADLIDDENYLVFSDQYEAIPSFAVYRKDLCRFDFDNGWVPLDGISKIFQCPNKNRIVSQL